MSKAVEATVNIVFNEVPIACRAPIAATDTRAAIKPYSIAVTPDSSFRNSRNVFIALFLAYPVNAHDRCM